MKDQNQVHSGDFLDNDLPDSCAALIIADPPYFETKGAFDFVWSSFAEYLEDVKKWAAECKRILKDNGSLFWWGDAKKIAYSQIILDEKFTILNALVWHKTDAQTRKNVPEIMRSFAPVTERCLFYGNTEADANQMKNVLDFETGQLFCEVMEPLVGYLIGEMKAAGLTPRDINEKTGTSMASHWFSRTSQWHLPTARWYGRLQEIFTQYGRPLRSFDDMKSQRGTLERTYEELAEQFAELQKEYELARRAFKMPAGRLLFDVLEYSQEAAKEKNFTHETRKPETLTAEIILATTRPDDLVVVPFSGSGTECAMAAKYGRRFVGFDLDERCAAMSNTRARKYIAQLSIPTE